MYIYTNMYMYVQSTKRSTLLNLLSYPSFGHCTPKHAKTRQNTPKHAKTCQNTPKHAWDHTKVCYDNYSELLKLRPKPQKNKTMTE